MEDEDEPQTSPLSPLEMLKSAFGMFLLIIDIRYLIPFLTIMYHQLLFLYKFSINII